MIIESLTKFIESRRHADDGWDFLFSPSDEEAGQNHPATIKCRFEESVDRLREFNEFHALLHHILEKDADMGHGLKRFDILLLGRSGSEQDKRDMQIVLDVALAKILHQIVIHREISVHPQNLRHILSHFSERTPEFLLVVDSLLLVITGQQVYALEERGRASRVLINNYDIETLFIYISQHPLLQDEERELILPWLITFQKIYRRLQDIIYSRKHEKVKVAHAWFQRPVSTLISEGTVPSKGYEVPDFVRRFLRCVVEDREEAVTIGRALVLVINNEDILRTLHHIIKEIKDPPLEAGAIRETYHGLFNIMQEYRRICTGQKESELEIKGKFASISRERREVEEITPMLKEAIYKTPVLGRKIPHTLLEDTEHHLRKGNLQHLYEIWPISTSAQEIFNTVCRLEEKLPEDTDIQFNHLLFQEKIYEFLMRLERLGIGIVKDSRIPIITNAFQLNSLNLIHKGLYLGSTGCWQCPNQIPPSIICCTNPHAINNCLGHRVRHIFLRVFLGTGEFYESPFILDSTPRYGSVDEEGLVDGLVIRPGLFLIEIPQEIRERWARVEEVQLSTALEKRINTRIAMENTGTFIMTRA